MSDEITRYLALAVQRVSSKRQWQEGDSPEDQLELAKKRSEELHAKIVDVMELAESAGDENDQPLQKAVDRIINDPRNIKYLIVKSVDRFTRAGSTAYLDMQHQLETHDKVLIDTEKVISGVKVN